MPKTDYQDKVQKLTLIVKDKTLDPKARIRAERRLLKITNHSQRPQKLGRSLSRELLTHDSAEVRKAAADLLEFLTTQRETSEDTDGPDEVQAKKIGSTNYKDPFDDVTPDDVLAELNKDVLADPTPAKFVYFPKGQGPQYLKTRYADLFSRFTDFEIEQMQGNPYNELPWVSFGTIFNPEFYRAYKYWLWMRFAHDKLPGHSSSWFLRFCREEDVRRWTELGTLVIPSEQSVGAELRRREHMSGFVKRHEIPFAYCLYLQILTDNTNEDKRQGFVTYVDTPPLYLNEFNHLKTDEERKAEREAQNVSQ